MEDDIDNENYSFAQKWTTEIEQYGFTQVPNALLKCQGHLGLTDGELVTLINLLHYWYRGKAKAFPSITTLTKFSGKNFSTLQKRLKSLEDKGFLVRQHRRNTSNTYVLTNCIKKLNKHLKVCPTPPRNRSVTMLNLSRDPSYIYKSKEDEALRRTNFYKTMNKVQVSKNPYEDVDII